MNDPTVNDPTIHCEPGSLAGPLDQRAIAALERGFKLDANYLAMLPAFHGGVPVRQYVDAPAGGLLRVGRFLTIVDEQTKLPAPAQPSWETPDRDIRIDRSIDVLIDEEGHSCQYLFNGERLIPFAALWAGDIHPDGMSLTRADCDLLCFDTAASPHAVVLWRANDACDEYLRWENLPIDDESDPDYAKFTERVADCFLDFASMLRESP